MSALSDAITRSFSAEELERPAVSPLRALGRRRLSGVEVLAQSVATTAPAASMVVLPMTMLRNASPLVGLLTILGATILISLIALCVTQFTRRQAAAGGLYSFVYQGLGTRAALTTGVAVLIKYLGSATLTLYSGSAALTAVLRDVGVDVDGPVATLAVHAAVAAAALAVLVRGARFAALAILAVEAGSLLFIVALTLLPAAGAVPPPAEPVTAPHGVLYVALAAIFALAGFESATFFGPEAKRPLVTITRTVLLTPMICGGLFVFAAWAAWTGRSTTIVDVYLHGTDSGAPTLLVVALNLGLACSWLASATASSHAASRLVYSMGVERLLPRSSPRCTAASARPTRLCWSSCCSSPWRAPCLRPPQCSTLCATSYGRWSWPPTSSWRWPQSGSCAGSGSRRRGSCSRRSRRASPGSRSWAICSSRGSSTPTSAPRP